MSIFPTKVLLATDGSTDADIAAKTAVDLAKNTDSELHVIYVEPALPMIADFAESGPERTAPESRRLLDEQVRRIGDLGGAIAGAHLRLGRPEEQILRTCEEVGAGLILLGSRGHGGVMRTLLGSVSDSVVRHAHCPVMVVRWAPVVFPTRILLATDGSEDATLAAGVAADLAERTRSELHVVYVAPNQPMFLAQTETAPAQIEREARQLLDEQVKRIEEAGGTVKEAHLRLGRADEQIFILAEEISAGLLAMGSRGLGGIRRALVGSVSDSVVRHSHGPVLIVRG